MQTYLKILSYARPFATAIPLYLVFTLLYVVFSLVNFTVLIPLLQILFDQVDQQAISIATSKPDFSFTIDYFKETFYYYFGETIRENGKKEALKFVCLVIITSVFLGNFFRYLTAIQLAKFRIRVVTNLRNAIYDKITNLEIGYFTENRKGDLMARVTSDVLEIETSVVSTIKVMFKEPALVIGFFVILFTMSFSLTLYTLLLLPVSGGIISYITKRLKKRAQQSQESLGRINSLVDETLTGVRIIKAFTAKAFMMEKFGSEVKNYARQNMSIATKFELAGPISEFLGVGVVCGLLLIGGNMVLDNQSTLSASEFIAFIIIFSQILNPIKAIAASFSNIQRGLASGERVFAIINTPSAIKDTAEPKLLASFEKGIEFQNVSFGYGQQMVLKNINLTIKKGTTIALVGPSGSGKSTMADLIPRFYDPLEGRILLDGVDLREYKLHDLRFQMGIVTQESILFNDTVFNNIAFGKKGATMDDVVAAAKVANAHGFISDLSEGYHTNIGDRGGKLSGGQRQRISIARAVLKNPPIMVLDEATSALDSESEKLVQGALTNLMKNRTSIVIAHRLSTIQNADLIVVVKEGQIVEQGTHTELMAKDGIYQKLSAIQAF